MIDEMFPPHARGWTGYDATPISRTYASPARAGMDPTVGRIDELQLGFPRTRGDGPSPGCESEIATALPPHARGWTHENTLVACISGASPARAGMDRTPTRNGRATWSFPRTRGDGPLPLPQDSVRDGLPPHARGWTSGLPVLGRCCHVSPARAGMDPPPPSTLTARYGFPRTRGDGPWEAAGRSRAWKFPPHARGWTEGQSGP